MALFALYNKFSPEEISRNTDNYMSNFIIQLLEIFKLTQKKLMIMKLPIFKLPRKEIFRNIKKIKCSMFLKVIMKKVA